MSSDLISKKELLQVAGISYGQLYRWKRKNLIPEDWFIRKSTFTGQETFFPRDKILVRIERIQGMQGDDLSLDDIAEAVTPDLGSGVMKVADVLERGVLSETAVTLWREAHPESEEMVYGDLLGGYVLDGLLKAGEITVGEGPSVLQAIEEGYAAFEGRECDLVVLRKMGVCVCLLVSSSAELRTESGAREVARVTLSGSVEELAVRAR
ncbi:MAG: YhbD family protein [Actinomycetota bacterium]|nr:YhbD family protein [Actinomycetota bacterium]